MRTRLALALAGATLALGACADDLYGPYGYGSIGIGYGGYGYPYDYWGAYPYGGYGGYYGGFDPFGWYGNDYYPGVGFYVYDSYRRPHRWNGDQERYWTTRRNSWQGRTGNRWNHEDWRGFRRSGPGSGPHWRHRG